MLLHSHKAFASHNTHFYLNFTSISFFINAHPSSLRAFHHMAQPAIKLEHPLSTEHAPGASGHNKDTAPSESSTMASTPVPETCDDQVNAQLDLLGRPVQKLVQLIKDLEGLGVETKKLPLPKIVVVGDQSAGKSSVSSLCSFISRALELTND